MLGGVEVGHVRGLQGGEGVEETIGYLIACVDLVTNF